MVYIRRKTFHTLTFEGEYAGLNIRVRALTGQGMIEYNALEPAPTMENPVAAALLFLASVDRWDLEYDDGGQVPVTFDAFFGFDVDFIKDVLRAWLGTLGQTYPATAPGQSEVHPGAVAATPVADVPGRGYDAPDAEDMDIPVPAGPELFHLERFVHPATVDTSVDEPVPV